MGSGDRFKYGVSTGIGFYVALDVFPYELTIDVLLPFCWFTIGLGKPYDDDFKNINIDSV